MPEGKYFIRKVTGMKIFRKLAAVFTAAAIAVAAAATIVVTAGAESIYDTAVAISSGKAVTTILPNSYSTADYKITSSGNGTLKLSIESHIGQADVEVYDSNGEKLSSIANTSTSGNCDDIGTTNHDFWWNSTIEKYSGTVSYSVKAGTYYIRFVRNGSVDGNGKLNITATYPTASKTATISYITINLKKGSKLSLGAALSGSGKVTWKSSKPSVATVSSTGTITAKKGGSTIITAKCGSSSKKIKITVK